VNTVRISVNRTVTSGTEIDHRLCVCAWYTASKRWLSQAIFYFRASDNWQVYQHLKARFLYVSFSAATFVIEFWKVSVKAWRTYSIKLIMLSRVRWMLQQWTLNINFILTLKAMSVVYCENFLWDSAIPWIQGSRVNRECHVDLNHLFIHSFYSKKYVVVYTPCSVPRSVR
jgi:hypothetical protein